MLEWSPVGRLCSRLKLILMTTAIVVSFPIIGAAFYARLGYAWLRDRFGLDSRRASGFLFASAYGLLATLAACRVFPGNPIPRFHDFFLLGIVLTAYRFDRGPALFLFALALPVSVWLQPGLGSLAGGSSLASFAVVSMCSILVVARLKKRRRSVGKATTLLRFHPISGA